MRRAICRPGLMVGAALAAALLPGGSVSPASAAPVSYFATLSGAHVVPPVQTAASGVVQLLIDSDTGAAEFSIILFGITAADVEAAELRQGGAGTNGILVQKLTGGGWTQVSGSIALNASQVASLNAGMMYVEVRSVSRGAIVRGPLVARGVAPAGPVTPTAIPTATAVPQARAQAPAVSQVSQQITPPSTGDGALR